MTRRPSIKTTCVADKNAAGAERIVEFSGSKGVGGLISVREMADGSLQVCVYRLDDNVVVFCPKKNHRPSLHADDVNGTMEK